MTKSLQATFEKLHPRSGRFYDAETNRYFALSKQAGDTGKRVDSDSQQFWEFYQLCFGALQGELDEAIAQVAMLWNALQDLLKERRIMEEFEIFLDKGIGTESPRGKILLSARAALTATASTAKAHDKAIWDEGWVAGRDAAAVHADEWAQACRNIGASDHDCKLIADGIRKLVAVPTDKNGSGE